MANPPAAVKLALESICLLLGESTTDWKQIRSIIMRENFIPTIVNFSAEEIRWVAPGGGNCSGGMRFSCLLWPRVSGLAYTEGHVSSSVAQTPFQAISTQTSQISSPHS